MATIDTIADRSSGSAIAGKAYFETSTNKFIVFNGTAWIELDSDGVGAVYENRWGASFDKTSTDGLQTPAGTFNLGNSPFTFSVWFKASSLAANYHAVFRAGSGASAATMFITSGGDVQFSDWSNVQISSGFTVTTGAWHHAAFVKSTAGSTSIDMYVDGIFRNSGSLTISDFTGSNNTIGHIGNGGSTWPFDGKIDEFAFWDTALSAADITKIYNGTAPNGKPTDLTLAGSYDTDRTANLKGYWRMGDDSSDSATSGGSIATITDSSGNGNDATQSTASAQPTFKALASSTTSISFDGSSDYLEKTFSSAPCAGAYTIGFWFNTSTSPSFLSLFESTDTLANYNGGFRVYRFGSDGTIRLATANSSGSWSHEAYAYGTSLNTWHYVVITRSAHGAVPEIYIDGVVPSGSVYGTPQTEAISAKKLRIGSTYSGGLTGYMDEVSFFNSELTGSDLTAYLSAVRGTHLINDLGLSPTAYWRMGEDDNLTDGQTGISQITDASGNGNHVTQATASAQPTASVDPVIYV